MSDTNGLQVFLREKARSGVDSEIDWEARKREWLGNLADLYELILTWLDPLVTDDLLRSEFDPITVTEEPIGPYKAPTLTIFIGNQNVRFCPKGTLIVGAQGRVDIRGRKGVRTIVLNEGQWSVVERAPRLKTLPFDESSFQDILSEVMA